MSNLPLEQVEDLGVQRMQGNISRKFDQINQSDGATASFGGDQEDLGNNSYKVKHGLTTTPKGFVITSCANGAVKAKMINPNGTDVTITWDSAPGTFTVSFY